MKNSSKILIMAMSLLAVDTHGSREPWDISDETLKKRIDEAIINCDGDKLAALYNYTAVYDSPNNEDLTNGSAVGIYTLNAYIGCFIYLKAFIVGILPNAKHRELSCSSEFYTNIITWCEEWCNQDKAQTNYEKTCHSNTAHESQDLKNKIFSMTNKPTWLQKIYKLGFIRKFDAYVINSLTCSDFVAECAYCVSQEALKEDKDSLLDICNDLKDDIIARLEAVNDPKNKLKKLRIIFDKLKDLNFDVQ